MKFLRLIMPILGLCAFASLPLLIMPVNAWSTRLDSVSGSVHTAQLQPPTEMSGAVGGVLAITVAGTVAAKRRGAQQ